MPMKVPHNPRGMTVHHCDDDDDGNENIMEAPWPASIRALFEVDL